MRLVAHVPTFLQANRVEFCIPITRLEDHARCQPLDVHRVELKHYDQDHHAQAKHVRLLRVLGRVAHQLRGSIGTCMPSMLVYINHPLLLEMLVSQ